VRIKLIYTDQPNDFLRSLDREARVRWHQRRVEREEAEHPPETLPVCWACGKKSAATRFERQPGWMTRWIAIGGVRHAEIYCPECFATWGWPPLRPGERVIG